METLAPSDLGYFFTLKKPVSLGKAVSCGDVWGAFLDVHYLQNLKLAG